MESWWCSSDILCRYLRTSWIVLEWDKILVSRWELLVGVANEDDLVDNPTEATTDERANPVDPVVIPGLVNYDRFECEGGGGHEGQEEGCHHGAQELGDNVDDTAEKGDVASDKGIKGDGGVHVTSEDVGTDEDGDKRIECMGDGGGDEIDRCDSALSVSLLKAMPESKSVNTMMRVEMNSVRPAFNVSGLVASSGHALFGKNAPFKAF
ncbi:hypothetical protein VNO80_10046 [Phaseolus coccineus]|uniref:Uncharacterized protein n=1 Tax=Phaseolus coccineus TaxID=3886 RepID=A0AAN9N7D5_PHACN